MKVLIAIDEFSTAELIVEFIYRNNWLQEAEVRLVYVVTPIVFSGPLSPYLDFPETAMKHVCDYGESVMRKAADQLMAELGKQIEWTIPLGDAAHSIVDEAQRCQSDLIIMGTHSPKGLQKLLCGSVSQAVAANAPCSVLILKIEQQLAETSR